MSKPPFGWQQWPSPPKSRLRKAGPEDELPPLVFISRRLVGTSSGPHRSKIEIFRNESGPMKLADALKLNHTYRHSLMVVNGPVQLHPAWELRITHRGLK